MLLHDLAEGGAQANALVAGAVEEVARAPTERSRQLLQAPLASHREPMVGLESRPVRHRTLWDTALLEETDAVEVMRARRVGGEDQRLLPRIPLTLLVVDDAACLLEWPTQPTGEDGPVGLVVRTTGLVRGVLRLCERMGELASRSAGAPPPRRWTP